MYTDKLFTGQRQVAGLGIYHYQSRFYSPKLGKFLSADTIVPNPFNPQDFNRFSYVRNNPVRYVDPSGHICVQNGGGVDNEFAIAGNCNGGEKANYKNPFPGGVPTVNKPGKPKKDDGGAKDIPELSKDDDASQTPTSTTTPAPEPGETPVTSSTPMLEPPGTDPLCKDADACETDIALLTLELVHLLAFDVLMLVLVGEAVAAGPAGWVGLALVSPVIVGFYYRTWQTFGEIREVLEWRDYYNEISP